MRTPMLQMCLRQGFGLTDFFSDRNQKNSEYEFKKEMNFMANKPTFTIMDYKQRILSEYKKAKDSISFSFRTNSQAPS